MKRAQFHEPWDDESSPWRTVAACARYLRMFCPNGEADLPNARAFLDKRVAAGDRCKRGKLVLYRKDAVEQSLTRTTP